VRSWVAQLSRAAPVIGLIALVAAVGSTSIRLLSAHAHAAAPYIPNDPGESGEPEGWMRMQWNFVGPYGVDAPHAWGNLVAAGAPGGDGVVVAVVDTGVAYGVSGRAGSPDLDPQRIVPGYDFVDHDRYPFDENGHGTHVASTIAEETGNHLGLTGLAYGVRIMPVRVLDGTGDGDAATIARGVRFAAEHGAKVINLSLNFDTDVTAGQIPELISAIEYARKRGSLIVAGAGNTGSGEVTYPARGPHVVAVGATTADGCLASYSNDGEGLDLVAPGGGRDADLPGDPACHAGRPGPPVYQITLVGLSRTRFDVAGYIGTSMAAPQVSATAALVIASRVIGTDPSPAAIEARLEQTARDLGRPGYDPHYGWGLVDAATATSPGTPSRPVGVRALPQSGATDSH
jgi:serine protease